MTSNVYLKVGKIPEKFHSMHFHKNIISMQNDDMELRICAFYMRKRSTNLCVSVCKYDTMPLLHVTVKTISLHKKTRIVSAK